MERRLGPDDSVKDHTLVELTAIMCMMRGSIANRPI